MRRAGDDEATTPPRQVLDASVSSSLRASLRGLATCRARRRLDCPADLGQRVPRPARSFPALARDARHHPLAQPHRALRDAATPCERSMDWSCFSASRSPSSTTRSIRRPLRPRSRRPAAASTRVSSSCAARTRRSRRRRASASSARLRVVGRLGDLVDALLVVPEGRPCRLRGFSLLPSRVEQLTRVGRGRQLGLLRRSAGRAVHLRRAADGGAPGRRMR